MTAPMIWFRPCSTAALRSAVSGSVSCREVIDAEVLDKYASAIVMRPMNITSRVPLLMWYIFDVIWVLLLVFCHMVVDCFLFPFRRSFYKSVRVLKKVKNLAETVSQDEAGESWKLNCD